MKCSEDELILYLYVELDSARYDQISKQLEIDDELRRRLQRLKDDLGRITQASGHQNSAAEAPAAFKAGWHDTINSVAEAADNRIEPAQSRSGWPLMGLVASLLLAIGFGFGYLQRGADTSDEGMQANSPEVVLPESAPLNVPGDLSSDSLNASHGVREHLHNVQNVLSSLDPAEAEQRRRLLREILVQNELHQKVAQLQGADDLARLLRAFEQSLLVIAAQSSGEVYASREQLNFELGVVLTKLDNQASNRQQSL